MDGSLRRVGRRGGAKNERACPRWCVGLLIPARAADPTCAGSASPDPGGITFPNQAHSEVHNTL
jgi:hypothetical protein